MLPSLCCAPPSPLLQASCSDAFTPERWGVAGAIAAALKAVPKSAAELLPWRAGAAPPAPALSASCSSPSCAGLGWLQLHPRCRSRCAGTCAEGCPSASSEPHERPGGSCLAGCLHLFGYRTFGCHHSHPKGPTGAWTQRRVFVCLRALSGGWAWAVGWVARGRRGEGAGAVSSGLQVCPAYPAGPAFPLSPALVCVEVLAPAAAAAAFLAVPPAPAPAPAPAPPGSPSAHAHCENAHSHEVPQHQHHLQHSWLLQHHPLHLRRLHQRGCSP
eukprot:1161512-Pelagomonas_calceolata.AAC.17